MGSLIVVTDNLKTNLPPVEHKHFMMLRMMLMMMVVLLLVMMMPATAGLPNRMECQSSQNKALVGDLVLQMCGSPHSNAHNLLLHIVPRVLQA